MKRWLGILAAGGALAAGVASAGDGFALRLWQAEAGGREGNMVVSPFSAAEAMGMALAGAQGETAAEIARAVLPEGVEDGPGYFARVNGDLQESAGEGRLRIANAVWSVGGKGFPEGYARLVEEAFGGVAEASERGSAGAARANRWASETTEGRIRDLFQAEHFGAGAEVVIANATFFRGRWEKGFDKRSTAEGAFRLRDGRTGRTPTMHRKGRYEWGEWEDGAMVRLPYEGGDLEMRVVLPKDGTGLEELEARLAEEWDEWAEATEEREVEVWLPRFTVRRGAASLKGALERLGVEKAFGDEADFSGMGAEGRLADVVHAAEIEVDEEGTTAAAVTAAFVAKSMRKGPPTFRADRPFLFAVVEKVSGTVLFFGRVERPNGWVADDGEDDSDGVDAAGDGGGDDEDVEKEAAAREESGGAAEAEESEERI